MALFGKSKVALQHALLLFDPQVRLRLGINFFLLVMTNFIELFGVVYTSLIIGSLLNQDTSLKNIPQVFGLDFSNFAPQDEPARTVILLFYGVMILLGRSSLSYFLFRNHLKYLVAQSNRKASQLFEGHYSRSISEIRRYSSQQTLFSFNQGFDAVTINTMTALLIILNEVALTVILFVYTIFTFPVLTLILATFLGLSSFYLIVYSNKRFKQYGRIVGDKEVRINEINEILFQSAPEIRLRGKVHEMADLFRESRQKGTQASQDSVLLTILAKYFYEFLVLTSILLILAFGHLFSSSAEMSNGQALIILIVIRVIPSLLRLQGALNMLKGAFGLHTGAIDFFQSLFNSRVSQDRQADPEKSNCEMHLQDEVTLSDLSLSIGVEEKLLFRNMNVSLPPGTKLLVSGPSGAGKSSFLYLIAGLLKPTTGKICISGLQLDQFIPSHPGYIGFLQQEPFLMRASLRANIEFFNKQTLPTSELNKVIEICGLDTVVSDLPFGLESDIGHYGSKLSGGQRRRIGLARALYTNPKVLLLDEFTNGIDEATKYDLLDRLVRSLPKTTIIAVSHDTTITPYFDYELRIANQEWNLVKSQKIKTDI